MTIKNYDQAYKSVMQELQEISKEDLISELRSYENGPLGQAFSASKEIFTFRSDFVSVYEPRISYSHECQNFVAAGTHAANDFEYDKAA